jgi:hypothetical protein
LEQPTDVAKSLLVAQTDVMANVKCRPAARIRLGSQEDATRAAAKKWHNRSEWIARARLS